MRKENFVKSYLIVHNFKTAPEGEINVLYTKSMISKIMFFELFWVVMDLFWVVMPHFGSFWTHFADSIV